MKKSILIAFLMLVQVLSAQEVNKNLGDFSTVKVYDRITVKLVKSTENKIVITGTRASEVELVTKKNELKIKMEFSKLLKGEDIEATLYYKFIDEIVATEGAFVSSEDTFKSTSFELNAKEGALIKIMLDVEKLDSDLHTGGILELYGNATNHDCTITSGGELKAKELVTNQTDVSINAGGSAKVKASDFVKAKIRAGGYINIYGSPKKVDQNTFAGGSITVME